MSGQIDIGWPEGAVLAQWSCTPLALVLYHMNMSLSPALSTFAPSLRSLKASDLLGVTACSWRLLYRSQSGTAHTYQRSACFCSSCDTRHMHKARIVDLGRSRTRELIYSMRHCTQSGRTRAIQLSPRWQTTQTSGRTQTAIPSLSQS